MMAYLDSDGTYSRNHVQVSSKYSIVGELWIVLPNGSRGFHSGNFGNMGHHGNVCQVNNVAKASDGKGLGEKGSEIVTE